MDGHLHAMGKHGQWRLNLAINAVISKTTSFSIKLRELFAVFRSYAQLPRLTLACPTHTISRRNQMPQPNERHVLLPVICEHCQQKQMVQMRARSEFHAMYPQSIKCVKCENSFDVTIPDEILGGPFLPSQ
jgi:hypothetical protein